MREVECEECKGRGQRCTVCGCYYTDELGCEECHAPPDKFENCSYCGGEGVVEMD
jgi:hypothetical protein